MIVADVSGRLTKARAAVASYDVLVAAEHAARARELLA
jgi:hypothetical protein